MYLVLYSIGRFGFSYVRQESPWWLGLQQAQVLSLLILAAALGLLVFRAFKRPGNQARPSGRS
jgi:prolipoprotein diacylglyceryltransferase